MEMQYFQAEFEFFTNLNPNVPPMEKPGSLYAKNVKKHKSRLKLDSIILAFMQWDKSNK